MQTYYDNKGRPRGYSRNNRQRWFWDNSITGMIAWSMLAIIRLCLLIVVAPFLFLPSDKLTDGQKAVAFTAWLVLMIVVVAIGSHSGSQGS